MNCIYCHGVIVKYGYYGRKQRYKCLRCLRTFSEGAIENHKAQAKKRVVLHLVLAGCTVSEICMELKIEKKTISKWIKAYFKRIKEIIPDNQLLAVRTLCTIYRAIEKSRIAGIHSDRRRSRRNKW